MNKIIHFEIQATNPKLAATFYHDVFNWDINEWVFPGVAMKDENRYWTVMTGPDTEPGINGGLLFRKGPPPAEGQGVNAYICIIGVDYVDKYVKKVLKAGGKLVTDKMAIQGMGWVAYCKDNQGNNFGMIQYDKTAK